MEVKLTVLEGKHKGRQIPLPETIFLIGRDGQCHLRPHCQGVSKLHCAIACWAGIVRVRDLNSLNGTFLNDQRIRGEVVARNGDRLRIGDLEFSFLIEQDAESLRARPIQDEREVAWLLDNKPESAVLQAATQTIVNPRATGVSDDTTIPGSKSISGGKNLHAYFEVRKRPNTPVVPPGNTA